MGKLGIFGELMQFLGERRKFWMAPIVIFLVLVGAFLVLTEASAITPFLYALF